MISQRAQAAFDHIVVNALRSALSAPDAEPCTVDAIDDARQITEKKVVLLTVSSYVFRVITMVYFTLNADTRQHFAAINRTDAADMSDADFLDVISECGNIFCGAFNRELAQHYPHLGMSTPNVLDRPCMDYLKTLSPGYVKHFKVGVNDRLTMHASLCVCDFAPIDFQVDTTKVEETHGELEMF